MSGALIPYGQCLLSHGVELAEEQEMRAWVAVVTVVAFAWATSAWAHDIDEVRSELHQKGFDRLEFSRTKPPFKLDACRGGQRFHLHVDYYGKITEQTPIGPCADDATAQPATPAATPPPPAPPANAPHNEASSIATHGAVDAEAELCARYFPELGKALLVPCAP